MPGEFALAVRLLVRETHYTDSQANREPEVLEVTESMSAATRRAIWAIVLFSALSHVLNLASPLFVMNVYDRVLNTRSVPTLALLAGIFGFLLMAAGLLDFFRGRILTRLANRVELDVMPRLSSGIFSRAGVSGPRDLPLEDLQALRMAITGNPGTALLDAPWILIYIALAFLLHPVVGWVAIASTALIGLLILAAQRWHTAHQLRLRQSQIEGSAILRELGVKSELSRSIGAHEDIARHWEHQRRQEIARQTEVIDQNVLMGSITKTVRLLVQIAILACAAWLAIRQEMSAGAIFAASIIVGRALMPLEVAASSWQVFGRGFSAWKRLKGPRAPQRNTEASDFSGPIEHLEVNGLYAGNAGHARPFLKEVTFQLRKGHALALAGGIGTGKSLLCRVLSGGMSPIAGTLRFDGMDAAAINPSALGRSIGYLPQTADFLPGTIAQNICRFQSDAVNDDIVAATRAFGMHETVAGLPLGYDTAIALSGLSNGQLQLLSLARSAYGSPSLLVLDMPETALDPDSLRHVEALIGGAMERGAIVVIVSHHPRLLRFATTIALMTEGRIARMMSAEEFFRRASGQGPVHTIMPRRD